MDYVLMHKYFPVMDLMIDETGYISKLGDDHNEKRLPPGIRVTKTGIDRKALNDWWVGRSIPASRAGISEALQGIGMSAAPQLIEKCFGLSLSDHYWICPKGSGLKWEEINFFDNGFSRDMGEILFGHMPEYPERVSLVSPDNTSDGWLRKKWVISGGKRFLMKGGSGVYRQEPFNEIIASALMRRLNIPHVSYTLTYDDGDPYCLCENFITPDTELIPAWRVYQTGKQPNNRSIWVHFLDCCKSLGIAGVEEALGKLLAVDYIIANEDRHMNNFGFVRNPETLEWLGLAPVYDSGSSLWHNTRLVGSPVESKPFRKTHEEQIKLAGDFIWYRPEALAGLDDEIVIILSKSEDADESRRESIASNVMRRCGRITSMTM